MKLIIVAVLIGFLGGCANGRGYVRQPWATVVKEQAEAECYNYIQSPAGWGTNLYLCMRSKGYFEAQ